MSMDLLRVTDATQSRFPPAGARMLRVSGGESGGKHDADHQILARLASPSSTVRLRLPGADAVLTISIESDEAGSMRDSQSVIDLADSEFGNDQLAVIMRWLGGQFRRPSRTLPQRLAAGGLTKWRLRRVMTYIDQHIWSGHALSQLLPRLPG